MATNLSKKALKDMIMSQELHSIACRDKGYTNFIDYSFDMMKDSLKQEIFFTKRSIKGYEKNLAELQDELTTMNETVDRLRSELNATEPNTMARFQARSRLELVERIPDRIKSCRMMIGKERKKLARVETELETFTRESVIAKLNQTLFKAGYVEAMWTGIIIPDGLTPIPVT